MKITITKRILTEVMSPNAWDDKFELSSDFPSLSCTCKNEDAGKNFIKGACLMAIGEWDHPPDRIEFIYKNHQEQIPWQVYEYEKHGVTKQVWQDYVADDVPDIHPGCKYGCQSCIGADPFLTKFGGVYNYI